MREKVCVNSSVVFDWRTINCRALDSFPKIKSDWRSWEEFDHQFRDAMRTAIVIGGSQPTGMPIWPPRPRCLCHALIEALFDAFPLEERKSIEISEVLRFNVPSTFHDGEPIPRSAYASLPCATPRVDPGHPVGVLRAR
jgi:hypothetical protein